MKTKTIEEVIRDLKAQCDTKASAVADLLAALESCLTTETLHDDNRAIERLLEINATARAAIAKAKGE